MPTEPEFKPPRKKPSIFWWLGAAFALLVALFLFQLFGPSPPIEISRETTFVTTPLRPNGLPDYEQDMLDRAKDGVTPDNNAATLLMAALWPGDLSPNDYNFVAAELGLPSVPARGMQRLNKYIQGVVAQTKQTADEAATPVESSESIGFAPTDEEDPADKLYDRILDNSWTAKEFPLIAKWVEQNQKSLDLLVEASTRERCYFPSPSSANGKPDLLIGILLPCQQSAREAGRALRARAMWNIGERRTKEAWSDLLATIRLGPLIAQGSCVVEELIGIAVSRMGHEGAISLLHESPPSAELGRQMLRDLDSVPRFDRMADIVDHMERNMVLDMIIEVSRGEFDAEDLGFSAESAEVIPFLHRFRIDWNTVLRKTNHQLDKHVEALRIKNLRDRHYALDQINRDLHNFGISLNAKTYIIAAIDPSFRTALVTSTLCKEWLSGFDTGATAENRANTEHDLLRIAIGLAIFRDEHGAYPNKLADLVPSVFGELPPDLFGNKTYFYKRTPDGYLLYSAGANNVDESGSSDQFSGAKIFEGQVVEERDQAVAGNVTIPNGADDIAIRIPRKKFGAPKPTAGE